MKDIILGSHVSFTKEKQLVGSVLESLNYGSNTFMIYTGAPQNTSRAEINMDRTEEAYELMEANDIDIKNVIIHAPYIINLANINNRDFSISFLKQEIKRSEELGIDKIVLHPGSHVGQGIESGINNIISALNEVLKDSKVSICLETMAGKGSELGSSFEEIKKIIDGVKYQDKIKVCLDTCHINDAGYDENNIDDILNQFNQIIGLDKLACVHINDSKNDIKAHKDRHENFGFGTIGFDNLLKVIYHPLLKGIPKILETPYIELEEGSKIKYPPYRFEIEMIKNKKFNPNLKEDVRNYYK